MKSYDPYTPGWKEMIRLSRKEAARLGHDYSDPAHFLLGIIRKLEGIAVHMLHELNVKLDDPIQCH